MSGKPIYVVYTPQVQQLFQKRLERHNYRVLRKGWPDLLVKRDDLLVAVEVKGPTDKLHGLQPEMLEILNKAGIPSVVAKVTKEGALVDIEGDSVIVEKLKRLWKTENLYSSSFYFLDEK
jgi:Holliday junction resolvase-like predicted endonuclease